MSESEPKNVKPKDPEDPTEADVESDTPAREEGRKTSRWRGA